MGDSDAFGIWFIVVIISLLGVVAKLVYVGIGKGGRVAILEHVPKLETERLDEIQERYESGGARILLLSSIPGLGSAIAAVAGWLETPVPTFVVLVFISNLIRNGLLVVVLEKGISLVSGG